jgi:FkbM family methyltransferase
MYDKEAHLNIVLQWYKDNETHSLSTTYDIDDSSIVFDIGAYRGDWSDIIFNKYHCNIYCFEPITEFYKAICSRFATNNKIKIFNYAVGGNTRKDKIVFLKDGSSMHQIGDIKLEILVKSMHDILNSCNLSKIDVLKLNVEGSEYEILEHLIVTKHINKFRNLFIQFHREVDGYVQKRDNIIFNLNKTHKRVFNYEMVWEKWEAI